ncbi:hypothetical protein KY289_008642 [Solanum tuberosum]|nr:hypothetical protein KY289_008642 [Solanum tuberosum]
MPGNTKSTSNHTMCILGKLSLSVNNYGLVLIRPLGILELDVPFAASHASSQGSHIRELYDLKITTSLLKAIKTKV